MKEGACEGWGRMKSDRQGWLVPSAGLTGRRETDQSVRSVPDPVSSPGDPGLAHCPASTNFFTNKAFVTPAGTSLRPPGSWEKEKILVHLWDSWRVGWRVARGARPGPQATPLHQAPCAAPTYPQYNTSISFWAEKATGATQTTSGSRGCWPRGQTSLERQPGRSQPRGWNPGSGCRRGSTS